MNTRGDGTCGAEILRVGDRMQMNLDFVRWMNAEPFTVRVREIRTEPDGLKVLVMENAE